MTELERRIKSKIPGEDTGITVHHTICDICCPSFHCGLDAYVKDGKIIKIEGTADHPTNKGLVCTKGMSNRQYIYRKDRIQTPLRRVGERGSGEFEPISWAEAYAEISKRLLDIKATFGGESLVLYSGYSKWYRAFMQRFAYAFGTPNYLTESSNCMTSTFLNWQVTTACPMASPDITNCGVFLGWAYNPYYSRHLAAINVEKQKKRGMKIIIVDPRVTPAVEKLADIHLQPKAGTDGALALGMAHVLIRDKMIDAPYIEKYVYGFDEYAAYTQMFTPEKVSEITGVPVALIEQAAHMIWEHGPVAINESAAPIAHHKNGFQAYRAIMALSAITGCFDRVGGQIPVEFSYNHLCAGFPTREHQFAMASFDATMRPAVGAQRFPLWDACINEGQANDLTRQLEQATPYPLKALLGFGFNYRISADSERLKKALLEMDFLVNIELFMTDTCKFCDIVLPACSSMERSELKTYPGGYLMYTKPVIAPLYDAKSDVDIICELTQALNLDDDLLKAGQDACLQDILSDLPIDFQALKNTDGVYPVPGLQPYQVGSKRKAGLGTESGKFELYSLCVAKFPHLDPLPTYVPSIACSQDYPFHLVSSARINNALHSRLHDVPWARSLRPQPQVDIAATDAQALGVTQDDWVEISSPVGAIKLRANLCHYVKPGEVYIYHGYRQADANRLTDIENVDPYSGFAGYRSTAVALKKVADCLE